MRVLSAATLALALAACQGLPSPVAPEVACTLIGCESQLRVLLDTDLVAGVEYAVEMCVDDVCHEASIAVPVGGGAVAASDGPITLATAADEVHFTLPESDWSGPQRATLRVADAVGGEQLVAIEQDVEFEREQPNGPGCPPICWFAEIRA